MLRLGVSGLRVRLRVLGFRVIRLRVLGFTPLGLSIFELSAELRVYG